MAKQPGKLLVQTGNGYLEIQSYEIAPFHGWINRILQKILVPSVGYRFDLTPAATEPAPKHPEQTLSTPVNSTVALPPSSGVSTRGTCRGTI